MHFDLAARKIGLRLNNLLIYDCILVNFLMVLRTKSTISLRLQYIVQFLFQFDHF